MSLGLTESLRLMFGNALLVRQEEGTEIDLQVGKTVTKAPRYMRTQLWLGVLQRFPGLGHKAAQQYRSLLRKPLPEIVADDIAKDVGRTFPSIPWFNTQKGRYTLMRVLRAYAAYDSEVNYCQGMNFLAALLLIWMPSEAEAFGGLVVLMKERGLRELYKQDMSTLQARLWQIGKLLPPKLAQHLEDNCVLPVLYASSWLLTAFSADFPIFWSSRVMDVIFTDSYIEPMMKVVLGIIKTCGPALMKSRDMESMVQYIKVQVPRWKHSVLQEVLTDSLATEWTPAQAALLKQIEGAESVVEAVKRIQSTSQDESPEQSDVKAAAITSEAGSHLIAPASPGAPFRSTSLTWASRLSAPVTLPAPGTPSSSSKPPDMTSASLTPPRLPSHQAADGLHSERATTRPGDGSPWESADALPQRSQSHLLDSPLVSAFLSDENLDYREHSKDRALSSSAAETSQARDSQVAFARQSSLANLNSTSSFGDFTGSSDPFGGSGRQLSRQSSASLDLAPTKQSSSQAEAPAQGLAEARAEEKECTLDDEDFWIQYAASPSAPLGSHKAQDSTRLYSHAGRHSQGRRKASGPSQQSECRSEQQAGQLLGGESSKGRHGRKESSFGSFQEGGAALLQSRHSNSSGAPPGKALPENTEHPSNARAKVRTQEGRDKAQQGGCEAETSSQALPLKEATSVSVCSERNLLDEDYEAAHLPTEVSEAGFVLLEPPSTCSDDDWNELSAQEPQSVLPGSRLVSSASVQSVDSRLEEELSKFTLNFAMDESRKQPMLP